MTTPTFWQTSARPHRGRRGLVSLALAATLLTSCSDAGAPSLPAETVATRRAFFGAENVDESGNVRSDRVLLSWFGIASLAAAFDGHVVLLDTYINNPGPEPEWVPVTIDQLVALAPEAIFIGHAHFDHEGGVGEIVARTGARVVGLPQHCDEATRQARSFAGEAIDVECVATLPADAPFGAAITIEPLGADVPITAVRHPHSGLASRPPSGDDGAASLLYRFAVGDFSLVWNDTVGPLREQAPALLESLAPADVQLGATLGLGIGEQGMRDPVDLMAALDVKVFLPLHHDVGRDGSSAGFLPTLQKEMAGRADLQTELRWLQDPQDYLQPIVFDPHDPRWR